MRLTPAVKATLVALADLDLDEGLATLRAVLALFETRRRGGDPHAAARARRDAALRALATMMGHDAPAERLAREIAERLARYRPMASETRPDRALMRQIVDAGLPIPGPDRLARILKTGEQKPDWIPDRRPHTGSS